MNVDEDTPWYIYHHEGDVEFMLFHEHGCESAFFKILPESDFHLHAGQEMPKSPKDWGFAIGGLVIDKRITKPAHKIVLHWEFRNGNIMTRVEVALTDDLRRYLGLFHTKKLLDVTDLALENRV